MVLLKLHIARRAQDVLHTRVVVNNPVKNEGFVSS